MLLFDLDGMRAAYNDLTTEQRDVLQTIALMFWANARPIEHEFLLIITNRVFQREMDITTLRAVLDALYKISFLRVRDPIEPEEAYLDAIVYHRERLLRHVGEIERIVRERKDTKALFQLAIGYLFRREINAALRAMSGVVCLERDSGTLVSAAVALNNYGDILSAAGRPFEEIESAYRDAAETGRRAAMPDGLRETARALVNLGDALRLANRPVAESEIAYREAAIAGRKDKNA